jgi:hypothetical protein
MPFRCVTGPLYVGKNVLFVLSRKNNFSAIWRLSQLLVTGLQIWILRSTYGF